MDGVLCLDHSHKKQSQELLELFIVKLVLKLTVEVTFEAGARVNSKAEVKASKRSCAYLGMSSVYKAYLVRDVTMLSQSKKVFYSIKGCQV